MPIMRKMNIINVHFCTYLIKSEIILKGLNVAKTMG